MATAGFKPEEKLHGSTNFNSWKARLTAILDENDLDDVVFNVTEEPSTNAGRLTYKRKQGKARRVIYDSIREELMPNITSLKTAKECYDTLVDLYEKKAPSQKRVLKKRLRTLKLNKDESVGSFFTKIKQAMMEVYNMHREQLSAANTMVLVETLHSVGAHAHSINSDHALRSKLQELGTMTQMPDPPLLRLESEAYQASLNLLQNLIVDRSIHNKEVEVEARLVEFCEEVLHVYLETASSGALPESNSQQSKPHWVIPLGSARRRELASRAPLVVSTLQAISGLKDSSFERSLSRFFPLLANLVSCEHGSGEVQLALSDMLSSWVGPILLQA